MKKVISILLIVGAGMAQSSHPQPADRSAGWMLTYCGKSENELARDKRFEPFLREALPTVPLPNWNNVPVNRAAVTFLWGVPGMLDVAGNRYVVASGCPAHACIARAMLWVDVQTNTTVFVSTGGEQGNLDNTTSAQYGIGTAKLFIASKTEMSPDRLPDDLRHEIVLWLHRVGVLRLTSVALLQPSGSVPVSTDQLGWTGKYASTFRDWE